MFHAEALRIRLGTRGERSSHPDFAREGLQVGVVSLAMGGYPVNAVPPPVIAEDHSGLLEEGLPEDPRDALVDERGEVLDRCLESDEGGGLLGRSKGAIGQSSS